MRQVLILIAATTVAGAAAAQTPMATAAPPAATSGPAPDQAAAVHAMAERLIAKTGHPELFENVSRGTFAEVRHKESGAICRFAADDEDAAIDLDPRKTEPGFDIYCHALHHGAYSTRLRITHLHDKLPLDQVFRDASQDLRMELSHGGKLSDAKGTFEDKAPIPGVTMADLPPSMTVRLSAKAGGLELYIRREVIMIGNWAAFSDFVVPRPPTLADPLGRLHAMGDFKPIADAQNAKP